MNPTGRQEAFSFLSIRWGDTLQSALLGSPSMISPTTDTLASARAAIIGEPVSLLTGAVSGSQDTGTDQTEACHKDCNERFPGLLDAFNHYLCIKHCETGSTEPPLTPEERGRVTTEQTDTGFTGQITAMLGEAGKRIAFVLVAIIILAVGLYALTRS